MKSLEYLLWCGRITDRDTSILNWVFFVGALSILSDTTGLWDIVACPQEKM